LLSASDEAVHDSVNSPLLLGLAPAETNGSPGVVGAVFAGASTRRVKVASFVVPMPPDASAVTSVSPVEASLDAANVIVCARRTSRSSSRPAWQTRRSGDRSRPP
jgi:hypothetical protein